ncbi:MAG: hypothetical protein WD793_07320 [Steroidobacteraceae bacterium]
MRLAWIAVSVWLATSGASSDGPIDAQTQATYWHLLDDWVKEGGPLSDVRSRVVDNCTKLVLGTVDYSEWAALHTTRRAELDFRVDVCVKATIHRVHPQPELSNAMFVAMLCGESNVALYRQLCARANLDPEGDAT